jgi:hypothetical protein
VTQTEWDEERLAAAFRERFDSPSPAGLETDIHVRIAGTSPSRLVALRRGGPARGLMAATVVVLLVATVALGVGGLGRRFQSPAPSDARAHASPGPSPTPTEQAVPGSVVGLPIIHVPDAIAIRDAGFDDRELAVQGWFTPSLAPSLRCKAPQFPLTSPLQSYCGDSSMWLTRDAESLIHRSASETSTSDPEGPALRPYLDSLDSSWQPVDFGIDAIGDSTPTDVVFIGHFDDRRAELCPETEQAACRDRFVVDSVAQVHGLSQGRSEVHAGIAASTVPDIDAIITDEAPQSSVLSMTVVDGQEGLIAIEPSLATGPDGLIGRRLVWVVRVLETDKISTYLVVDGSDAIYEMNPDNRAIQVGGTLPGPEATATATLPASPGSYTLDCGQLRPDTCETRAAAIVAENLARDPSKRVVSIVFSGGECGSYSVTFDDGTRAITMFDCFISPSPG